MAISRSSFATHTQDPSALQWSFNVDVSDVTDIAIVTIAWETNDVTSITIGGGDMILVPNSAVAEGASRVESYYITKSHAGWPGQGVQSVVIDFASSSDGYAFAWTGVGANQAAPQALTDSADPADSLSVDVGKIEPGWLILAAANRNNIGTLEVNRGTILFHDDATPSGFTGAFSEELIGEADLATVTWSTSLNRLAIMAMVIKTPGQEPSWIMRGGFLEATQSELASSYTQAQMAAFHQRELAAGPVPNADVMAAEFSRDAGWVLDRLKAGTGMFVLDNHGGDYSPASRALFVPGKAVTFKAMSEAGSIYGMFSGEITGYQTTPQLGGRVTRIHCEDRIADLRRTARVAMQVDTKTNSLVAAILDSVGIGEGDRTIDTQADDDIPFSLVDGESGGQVLDEVIKGGGHYAHVDGRGRVRFRDRNFNFFVTTVSTVNEFASFSYDLPLARVKNDVQIASTPRAVATSPSTVAWLDDAPSVTSGSTISFFLNWQDVNDAGQVIESRVPVTSLTTPVASTDWQLNTQADGGGSDLTGQASLQMSGFARSGLFTVINESGQNGFVSKLNVRGFPVRKRPAFAARSQDEDSIASVGRRVLTVETDLIDTLSFAEAYADLLLSRRGDPSEAIEIEVRNAWPMTLQAGLLDRIIVSEDNTGVNQAYSIFGVDHAVTVDRGLEHTVTYRLDLVEQGNYLVLDKDPEGKLDTDRTLAP